MNDGSSPRIGVVIWLNQDYGRRVLRGAMQAADEHGFDQVRVYEAQGLTDTTKLARESDGVIAVVDNNEAGYLRRLRRPCVLAPRLAAPGRRRIVAPDTRTVAALAAEHFLGLGLRGVAFLAHGDAPAGRALQASLDEALQGVGGELLPACDGADDRARRDWLLALPRPCGVLCQTDLAAKVLVRLSQQCELSVPDDIAVMGVGDDPIVCMTTHPPLSSVIVPAERIGALAIEMLYRRLRGERGERVLLPPGDIAIRQSTDAVAVGDPLVARALRFMRPRIHEDLTTRDIAAHLGVGQRTLELRFSKAMGVGVHEELTTLRLQRARAMLTHTDTPIKQIALTTGWRDLAHFNRFIKQHTGMAPSALRSAQLD